MTAKAEIELPAWMATVESIDAESKLYTDDRRERLFARTGGLVTGSVEGTWVADYSTGDVLLRWDGEQQPGDIINYKARTQTSSGCLTPTVIYFRVLRSVPYSEVQAMAAKWGGKVPLRIRPGKWYAVLTD